MRSVPIMILLLLFVSNLYLGCVNYPYPGFIKYLIFSIVYLSLAILLLSKVRFAELTGFLIPLAILFVYPVVLDFRNLNPWSSGLLSAFNAIVIICCFILLLLKLKIN